MILKTQILFLSILLFSLVNCAKDSGQHQLTGGGLPLPASSSTVGQPLAINTEGTLVRKALPFDDESEENKIANAIIGRNAGADTGVFKQWSNGNYGLYSSKVRNTYAEFSRQKLTDAYANTETVYYPFGGPDVIHPFVFFPRAKTLVLVGIEPIGKLPALSTAMTPAYQNEMASMMEKNLGASFYVSQEMREEALNSENATWSKIAAGVALLNFEIISSELGSLNEEGQWVNRREAARLSNSPEGVIFRCRRYLDPTQQELTIYYFQQNLAEYDWDDKNLIALSKSSPFLNFVNNFRGNYTSYLKAASFVSHDRSEFKTSTKLIFSGNYIVETESGVPFDEFIDQRNKWSLNLFGQYDGPSQKTFPKRKKSPLLERAYSDARNNKKGEYSDFVKSWNELPFRYDYNDGDGSSLGSSLFYATRNGAPLAKAAIPAQVDYLLTDGSVQQNSRPSVQVPTQTKAIDKPKPGGIRRLWNWIPGLGKK